MTLAAKPVIRNSTKHRYKLIEFSFITNSIKVPSKMIKNDRRFTIHIMSTVQKMLRTYTDKQTIEGVPV